MKKSYHFKQRFTPSNAPTLLRCGRAWDRERRTRVPYGTMIQRVEDVLNPRESAVGVEQSDWALHRCGRVRDRERRVRAPHGTMIQRVEVRSRNEFGMTHVSQRFTPSKATELCTAASECELDRSEHECYMGISTTRGSEIPNQVRDDTREPAVYPKQSDRA